MNPGDPCGDGYLFHEDGDYVLVSVVDGLGHGRAAHEAAVAALSSFEEYARLPLKDILEKTHARISATRGCVAFLGRIDTVALALECISIGNITCKIDSKRERYCIATPGVLGHKMRKLISNTFLLNAGDAVYLASDGISSRFDFAKLTQTTPAGRAEELYRLYRNGHDDATAVVVQLQAATHEQESLSGNLVSNRV